jgi:hypothetical protein
VTSLRDPLLQQAVKHRLRGEHAAAMALLKNLVASAQPTVEMKVFAIHEVLSNYQRTAIPPGENRLSAYLRNLRSSQGNAEVRRAIADALAHSFRHEANPIGAVAALDDNIRSHPNTSSVLAALYGKVSLAVTELNDLQLARTALAAMRALSPNARITKLASKLVESAEAPNAVSTSMSRSISEVKAMESLPKKFALEQNYPNPFNPTTTIRFAIPQNEHVTLKVYDLLGREVATLVNEARNAGSYDEIFDASKHASGMYIYKLQAGNFTASRKFVLMKLSDCLGQEFQRAIPT